MKNKKPKKTFGITLKKEPRSSEPAGYKYQNISWQFGLFDINSNWGLKAIKNRDDFFEKELFPKLKNFENNNWEEIERQTHGRENKSKHHSVTIDKIIREAQNRLNELNLNDIDELFSLRLDGKFRIWGIRKFGYLQILWLDPEHEICPAGK
jgi:hypothetical protein